MYCGTELFWNSKIEKYRKYTNRRYLNIKMLADEANALEC